MISNGSYFFQKHSFSSCLFTVALGLETISPNMIFLPLKNSNFITLKKEKHV